MKLKLFIALALLGAGFLLGKLTLTSPVPKETIVYQDRIVTVDRVVNKDVHVDRVTTTTKPDGTKVVEVDKSQTVVTEKERSSEDTKTKITEKVTALSKYSLGVTYRPEHLFPLAGVYGAEAGVRILQTPLWVTASFSTKREATLGLRLEW